MKRRVFTALAGSAAAWLPLGVRAQQPASKRPPRIAYLGVQSASSMDPRQIAKFKAGLIANKLIDGDNVVVEYDWADGSLERLQALVNVLVAPERQIDVIVTVGSEALRLLMATGTKIPIVLAIIGDPFVGGYIKTLSKPGGTVTGLSMSNADLESKRLEILKAAAPALDKVMVLNDPGMSEGVESVRQGARTLGVETIFIGVSATEQLENAFETGMRKGANGLAVMASPFLNFQRKRIIDLANRHRLPSVWETDTFARDGGLISYGPNFADMYGRSPAYVAKILKGANPGDLPVEQPTRFDLVINLRTAKLLGLNLSPAFLARADEVIE